MTTMKSKIVKVDKDGNIIYKGFLSSSEKASVDQIIDTLREEIPQIESDLEEEFGQSVMYKYNLGLILGDFLDKYNISISERREFWDEIKLLASKEDRKRNEGANSVTRSFYQQCYILSTIDRETVEKLSWRQWQSILDRVGIREDERIFQWIKNSNEKIKEDEWREFQKALHMYLKKKDTSVFSDDELFSIYDSIYLMSKEWLKLFKNYVKEHPKTTKIKTKSTWSKKFYGECFRLKKDRKSTTITVDICNEAFRNVLGD